MQLYLAGGTHTRTLHDPPSNVVRLVFDRLGCSVSACFNFGGGRGGQVPIFPSKHFSGYYRRGWFTFSVFECRRTCSALAHAHARIHILTRTLTDNYAETCLCNGRDHIFCHASCQGSSQSCTYMHSPSVSFRTQTQHSSLRDPRDTMGKDSKPSYALVTLCERSFVWNVFGWVVLRGHR